MVVAVTGEGSKSILVTARVWGTPSLPALQGGVALGDSDDGLAFGMTSVAGLRGPSG